MSYTDESITSCDIYYLMPNIRILWNSPDYNENNKELSFYFSSKRKLLWKFIACVRARACLPGIWVQLQSSNDDSFMEFTALVTQTGGGKRPCITHQYHYKKNWIYCRVLFVDVAMADLHEPERLTVEECVLTEEMVKLLSGFSHHHHGLIYVYTFTMVL